MKCAECKLPRGCCLCGRLPVVRSTVRVIIIRHGTEEVRASNTGRAVHAMVEGSVLLRFGAHRERLGADWLPPTGVPTEVLYPDPGATVLRPLADRCPGASRAHSAAPGAGDEGWPLRNLVVLDGSWSQARRMLRRVPGLLGLPRVALPPGPPPRWDVRVPPRKGYYCTLEAVIRAFEALGEAAAADGLAAGMEMLRERLLYARGQLRRSELLT